ncbi:hypothetical protein Taro_047942, partial [Colocasia esculenta]|nr:hypothetical protein [Colocasia esculenta]
MVFLTWFLGVSRGDTWLFLSDLVEVWDVGCSCRETLVSHGRSDLLPHVFDSAVSVGVVFDLTGSSFASVCWSSCCSDWWLAFQQGPSVLLLLLGARAASVVTVFARATVGFVLGLRIRVGVSRRLREPMCGVAFTVVNSGEVLPEFFSVGSGGGLFRACFFQLLCYLRVEFVFLIVFRVFRLRSWDFVCPQDRKVGFISRTLRALPDGGLRLVMRVSFPYFSLVARGGGAGMAFGVMSRTVETFV